MAGGYYRCPQCRTRKKRWADITAHMRATGHAVCKCSGYHYHHRAGSPYCHSNPLSPILEADRQGCSEEEIKGLAHGIAKDHPERVQDLQGLFSRLGLEFN